MARVAGIGIQDFSRIIENNCFYADKTAFIREWWENQDTVTLITRPRRFGKTLAVNMLECFFSVRYAGRKDLFEHLAIWNQEAYRSLQGTYPVISLSFANVKAESFQAARESIFQELSDLYNQHAFLAESSRLTGREKELFWKVKEEMSDMTAARSLMRLSAFLYKYYGKRAIILLDEYDTPMQEAYVNGYWQKLAEFMRKFMNSTFKTNPYLERGLMTGITRISRESVFSDLNNLVVVTTTTKLYETAFGFTEQEVRCALEEFGLQNEMDGVKRWYDGFRFGDMENIYNPWSILNFLKFREYQPYWANTSSNRLIGSLIQKSSPDVKMAMEGLLNGTLFRTCMDEQIVYDQLEQDEHAVWSLLLASGYLKAAGFLQRPDGRPEYVLDIVNLEVLQMFEEMFAQWFAACSSDYNGFIQSLFCNDTDGMNLYMNRLSCAAVSSFDSGKKPSGQAQPERFYHGLVLGMMLALNGRYVLTSNRESGRGRYDVMLEPKNRADDGIIFEFKVSDTAKEKRLSDTADAAIRQILDKNYAQVLEKTCRKSQIRIYGFAFSGKDVLIRGGYLSEFQKNSSQAE